MWSWCPSHFTLGGPRGREHWPSPAWPQPALWAPRGVRISPPVWESPQLWGSLHPVRKGVHAHMHAHGHTHSHLDAHGGSQTYAPRHTRPGGPGEQGSPSSLWPLGSAISNEPLCWHPPLPTGVPEGAQPSWEWGPGHCLFLCFPCTDSHCPPAIPRHILFNNLSLLNYLLAFATSPPPPCPPLPPSASSHKRRKWKRQRKMRHQYICK